VPVKPESSFWIHTVKPKLENIQDLYFVKVQQVAVRGIPDVLICYKGKFIAWELKRGKNKVKPKSLQWLNLYNIDKAGGIAREVNPENFEEMLSELLTLK